MGQQTFALKKGRISFERDMIIIQDEIKKQNRTTLIMAVLWILLGTRSFIKYLKTGELFLLLSLLIGILYFLSYIFTLLRSTECEIPLDRIKSIKVKRRLSSAFLDIRLNNNKLRRVIQVEDDDELAEYIKTNFKTID
jgi:hypothetical protein